MELKKKMTSTLLYQNFHPKIDKNCGALLFFLFFFVFCKDLEYSFKADLVNKMPNCIV